MIPAGVKNSDTHSVCGTGREISAADFGAAEATIEGFLQALEPGRYSCGDAEELCKRFTRIARFGETGKALMAKRVAETKDFRSSGEGSPAKWLSGITGDPVGESTGILQLGEEIEKLPLLSDAARHGTVSPKRLRQAAKAAHADPRAEATLIEAAQKQPLADFTDLCQRIEAQARSQEKEAERHRRHHAARQLRWWTDDEGMVCLHGRLAPDRGAALIAALEPVKKQLFREARALGIRDSHQAYMADALVALVTSTWPQRSSEGGTGGTGAGGATGAGAGTGGTGAGGATGAGAGGAAGAGAGGAANSQGSCTGSCHYPGPRATVELRLDVEALRRGHAQGDEFCDIPGVGPVSMLCARDLLGDSLLDLVITKGVDVVSVTHLGRSVPKAIQRALIARDRRCVVPNCTVHHGLEIDHWQVAFADGGATELWNLALLCHNHHRDKTYNGFKLFGGPGQWEWLSPIEQKTRKCEGANPGRDEAGRPRPSGAKAAAKANCGPKPKATNARRGSQPKPPPGHGDTPLFRTE